MNSICATLDAKQKAEGQPSSLADFATKESVLSDVAKTALKKLQKLEPPAAIKSNVDHFVSVGNQLVSLVGTAIKAAKANDQTKTNQLITQINALSKTTDVDANAIGARAC